MRALVESNIIGVMVYVRELRKATEWYCSKLGFELGDHHFNDFAELTIDGGYVMHLFRSEDCAPYSQAAFSLSSEDIEFTHAALKRAGVDVDPIQSYGDHRTFTFRDCEGNAMMVSQF